MKKAKKSQRRVQLSGFDQALQTAQHYHSHGKLPQAAQIYQQILQANPEHPDALHLLGVLFAQTGDLKQAEHHIRKAISINPKQADYHSHLGNVLKEAGHVEMAVSYHEKALKLAPREASIHVNLGVCLHELGEYKRAISHYEKALRIDPKNPKILNNLATSLCDNEELDRSIQCYNRALRLDKKFAGAYAGLGNALRRHEQLEQALEACDKALTLDPNYITGIINKGEVLISLERYDEAQTCLNHGQSLSPNNPDILFSLGNVHIGNKQTQAAIDIYLQVLNIDPNHKKTLHRITYAYRAQNKLDLAVPYCKKLTQLYPKEVGFRNLHAFILLQVKAFTEAWFQYGYRARWLPYFQKYNLSISDVVIVSKVDSLKDKHFFIHREQGLGDEIFFLRFVPELKRQGAKVSYVAGRKLTGLLGRQPWADQLIGQQEPPPKHDYHLLVGDLPLAFQMKTGELPPPPLPLEPPLPEKVQEIATRLEPFCDKPIVGITWQAGTKKEDNLEKDLPKHLLFKRVDLEELGQQLKDLDVHFVSVQRAPKEEDVTLLESILEQPLHDFSDLNDDIEGMLALLDRLDDYVGVSNTNMHLIAGLGKSARVLVPRPYDWRWPDNDNSSIWFPDFTVYRQGDKDDWHTCLTQLRADLLTQFKPC